MAYIEDPEYGLICTDYLRDAYGPDLLVDDETAVTTPTVFERLPNYSGSIPTGKYPGKVWRCLDREGWWLREYIAVETPGMIGIKDRHLVVVD